MSSIMSYCKECKKEKDPMDMNRPGLCKLCWSKIEDVKYEVGIRSWKTRRARYGISGNKGYYKGEKVKSKKGTNYY